MTATTVGWASRPCAGENCDRVLRSKNYPQEQAPGQYVAAGHGMCARCYVKGKDATPAPGSAHALIIAQHAADLAAFMTARRKRGVPEHGRLSVKLGAGNGP